LTPKEAEVHGLVALMEIQSSRFAARTTPEGGPILLLDQNRGLWDQLLIRRGLAALDRAQQAGAAGVYVLQAAIAACTARARPPEEAVWAELAELDAELAALAPPPVVQVNGAAAVPMARGPPAGLELLEALLAEPSLKNYPLPPAVRGDFLTK